MIMAYDSETVALLRKVLDEAWENLSPKQRAGITKSDLAQRILLVALQGERDPARLRTRCAVMEAEVATGA
jgi:hypothetical protein